MSLELAGTIRTLRRDCNLSYEDVMRALSEPDLGLGECFTFGKALTERAFLELKDGDISWK